MLLRPAHCHGAAAQVHHDYRLPARRDRFKHALLRCGKVDARAITTGEALDLHWHLFSLKLGRKAGKSDHYIRSFGRFHCFLQQDV